MASAVATDRLSCRRKIEMWDHDPGTASALITSPDGGTTKRYVAMRDYGSFQVAVMATVMGGNGPTLVEIVAAEDAAGTNVTQIKTSGTVAADAMGDWVMLECTAEEVNHIGKAAGYDFTHVGARITCHHAGDEAVVVYIRDEPRFPQDSLTPATTIA